MFGFDGLRNLLKRECRRWIVVLWVTLLPSGFARGQSWVWTTETVDTSGTATSLAVDGEGNVHISYSKGALTYGFRPAGESRWFTMELGHPANYTSIGVDQYGNPHICATYPYIPFRYAHFDGKNKKWIFDEVAGDTTGIEYACAVNIGLDGTPHLSWYQLGPREWFMHLRYAVLRDGAWMIRTLDFDQQTGKWNSMVLDSQGNPYISYDAYVKGIMKCAHWDGKSWQLRSVDSRSSHGTDYNIGMGSSLMLDPQENVHISYYTTNELRYARQQNNTWKIETVDMVSPRGAAGYRSSLVLDKNRFPHISYEDLGAVKLAHWDGNRWTSQLISPSGSIPTPFSYMASDKKQDTLYITFRDSSDGSLKVAVGRRISAPQEAPEKH